MAILPGEINTRWSLRALGGIYMPYYHRRRVVQIKQQPGSFQQALVCDCHLFTRNLVFCRHICAILGNNLPHPHPRWLLSAQALFAAELCDADKKEIDNYIGPTSLWARQNGELHIEESVSKSIIQQQENSMESLENEKKKIKEAETRFNKLFNDKASPDLPQLRSKRCEELNRIIQPLILQAAEHESYAYDLAVEVKKIHRKIVNKRPRELDVHEKRNLLRLMPELAINNGAGHPTRGNNRPANLPRASKSTKRALGEDALSSSLSNDEDDNSFLTGSSSSLSSSPSSLSF
jgi:hypothetical protein